MTTIQSPEELLSERDVYEKFSNLFADRELREARQRGEIEYFDLRKGPHYSVAQLNQYLCSKIRQGRENRKLNDDVD